MRALPNLAESNGKTKLPEISQKEKCYFWTTLSPELP
jgi:hypothetical protein